MLKRFLLNALSSMVGAWIALILVAVSIFLFCIGLAGSLATGLASAQQEQVKSRSILTIDLNGPIEEREQPMEPSIPALLNGGLKAPRTLDVIVQAIHEAADNDDIVALYIKCGDVEAAGATLDAIRDALLSFKKEVKGRKKIFAYGDYYSQGAYYIASVADKVYMNPAGELQIRGLASGNPYMKGLFDMLGIQFQVVKVGTFKSAVEPYILTHMSAPARAQMDTLLGNIWSYMRDRISETRPQLNPQNIDSLVSRRLIYLAPPQESVKAGFVDSLLYERSMKEILADISGREVEKLNFVSVELLASQSPWGVEYKSKEQIAVLFASGEIADGNNNEINFETLVPVINKLAEDKNVKGLVLRVNSPGGSVFGSDQIGEALDNFQSKGKPLAVSMGDYAASGGYWISACADRIFADPLTITGSIGIFGLIPNISGTLDKLGVNMETVATNPEAQFPSLFKPMDARQTEAMQANVDRGYDRFVSRVAKGRKMKKEAVLRIAEGRVWDARTAVKIGLVDQLGSLHDAIVWTAGKAGIAKSYDVAAYPEVEPNIWSMIQLGNMTMGELKEASMAHDMDKIKVYLLKKVLARKPVQAMMPEMVVVY